jgi:hypothetical protein
MKAPRRILRMINTFKKLSNGKFEDNGMLKAMEILVVMGKKKTLKVMESSKPLNPKNLNLLEELTIIGGNFRQKNFETLVLGLNQNPIERKILG